MAVDRDATTTKPGRPDMSEAAIAARLEQVRALYKLMVSLRQVRGNAGSNPAPATRGTPATTGNPAHPSAKAT